MRTSHEHMKLTDLHVNAFIELMNITLLENGVSPNITNIICDILESFRKDLVSIKPSLFEKLGGEKRIN